MTITISTDHYDTYREDTFFWTDADGAIPSERRLNFPVLKILNSLSWKEVVTLLTLVG